MSLESIMPLALKVLGCGAAIYVIAGFLVSCSRLLPFLAMLSSVGTIFSISFVKGTGEVKWLWLPVAMSILTQLFYKGQSFMNPKIHENIYQLVSVERKWNSIFEEYDDYELHFSPFETGGFIENTLLNGVFFGLYYYFLLFLPDSWVVYIFPVYIIGMSLIDLLAVLNWLNLSQFFYGAIRILILIFAVAIGFLGPFGHNGTQANRRESIYERCLELVKIDLDISYEMNYVMYALSGYEYDPYYEKYFVYDSETKVGADYEPRSWGRMYNRVYAKNSNFGDEPVMFSNAGGREANFKYIGQAEEVGGLFKYSTAQTTTDFMDYYEFTRYKFDHMGGTPIVRDDDAGTMKLTYISAYDSEYDSENNMDYTVSWIFNMDKNKLPVSLKSVSCKIKINSANKEEWTYTPLYDGTNLEELFDYDGNLLGYTYNPDEVCGVNMDTLFNSLNGVDKDLLDYDFKVHETHNGSTVSYLYDSQTQMTAIYINRREDAERVNQDNLAEYKPDYLVSHTDYALYDGDYNLIESTNKHHFIPFTYNDPVAAEAIIKSFWIEFIPENVTVRMMPAWGWAFRYDTALAVIRQPNMNLEADAEYSVTIDLYASGSCSFQSIYASFTYGEREYSVRTRKVTHDYTIPAPPLAE